MADVRTMLETKTSWVSWRRSDAYLKKNKNRLFNIMIIPPYSSLFASFPVTQGE